jgi:hypothetical protein
VVMRSRKWSVWPDWGNLKNAAIDVALCLAIAMALLGIWMAAGGIR